MAEMESRARMKGITQLELSFAEGNDRAMALYEKMGFAICAKMPNAYRLSDGRSLCEIFMIKEL
jgi:ribosomal protein S18 acetylase RimI-like enzyme